MFHKTPEKLEARAQGYEAKGKSAKALKYRQKAARLRAGAVPLNGTQIAGSNLMSQPLTGLGQQQPILLAPVLNQQPNYGHQQPTLLGTQQSALGQQAGLLTQQQGLLGQQGLMNQGLLGQQKQSGIILGQGQGQLGQQQAGLLGQQGFGQQGFGQQGLQQGLGLNSNVIAAGQPQPILNPIWTSRTPAVYESNAAKWEQRGNWNKAQKNRGKVWRLQNPQYAQMAPPQMYQNNQFVGYNVPYTPTHMTQPTEVERHVHPTIVEETMRPERIVEIQPVVHREIEAPQVNIVERHTYETVPNAGPSTYTNAPIVQETVHSRIIEEVQPFVHREVPAPFVEKVEQHVTEHIVNPTITTKEVIDGGMATSAPFVAAGGPMGMQQTTNQTTQKAGLMGKVQNALHHNQTNQTL